MKRMFTPVIAQTGILHGGDYNPEQWLHDPAALAEDLVLMQRAGVTAVSLGIFAWSTIEPADGRYEFAWLDGIMDGLHGAGVGVFLATATAARPQWLGHAHPEVLRTGRNGQRDTVRMRHNNCWTSPVFRRKSAALIERLAERYAKHPALRAWHINNEYTGAEDNARCYCATCLSGFQQWLQQRYGTIDQLNRAWWTRFWSHDYQAWEQIRPQEYDAVEALELNWRRYHAQQVAEFYRFEVSVVRRHSTAPCFTNFHDFPPQSFDIRPLAEANDVLGYDSYPFIVGKPVEDDRQLQTAAFTYDLMRSLKHGAPFWMIESCPGQPQWKGHMRAKRPGVHRALSLQAVAHGADAVMYFQWRAGRGGMEKLHGAVVEHGDPAKSRVFGEVSALSSELAGLDALVGAGRPAKVALLYDITCRDAGLIQSGPGHHEAHRDHLVHVQAWYRPLWKRGVTIDIVGPEDDLTGYKLVLAPQLTQLTAATAQRLHAATHAGATLLVGPWSGLLDEDMSCWPGGRPGPLADILGVRCSEVDVLAPDATVALTPSPGSPLPVGSVGTWFCEIAETHRVEVLATFASEFYAGRPALTSRQHETGRALFLATCLGEADLDGLLTALAVSAGVPAGPLASPAPDGVSVQVRQQPDRAWCIVTSVVEAETSVRLNDQGWLLPDGTLAPLDLRITACGTLLLTR